MKAEYFNQVLTDLLPLVKHYTKHRLSLAEKKKLINSGVYEVEDVVDQALLKLYQLFLDQKLKSKTEVKVGLFRLINQELYLIISQEKPMIDSLSTEEIYQQELTELLEVERLTRDADGEVVFLEDLDEKEYPLKEPAVWILESDILEGLINALDLNQSSYQTKLAKQALAYHYAALKPRIRELVDLITFGRLTLEEAAAVVEITPGQAKIVLNKVKEELTLK